MRVLTTASMAFLLAVWGNFPGILPTAVAEGDAPKGIKWFDIYKLRRFLYRSSDADVQSKSSDDTNADEYDYYDGCDNDDDCGDYATFEGEYDTEYETQPFILPKGVHFKSNGLLSALIPKYTMFLSLFISGCGLIYAGSYNSLMYFIEDIQGYTYANASSKNQVNNEGTYGTPNVGGGTKTTRNSRYTLINKIIMYLGVFITAMAGIVLFSANFI